MEGPQRNYPLEINTDMFHIMTIKKNCNILHKPTYEVQRNHPKKIDLCEVNQGYVLNNLQRTSWMEVNNPCMSGKTE